MSALPRTTPGVRLVILAGIVLGVLFVAYKVGYTDVPPERLAAAELVELATAARTPIAETLADRGSLEGSIETLLPPAQREGPNSKGPFVWTLDAEGTLTGRSERYGVELTLRTEDHGATWSCVVTPAEQAPQAGACAAAR
jgi:hypothetical protein